MQPGDLISRKYRLVRPLGAGGMGSVWAARNELTDRDFAIKFLLPLLANNDEALQRFFLEARACGQMKHPAIVDVYDMGQVEDGSPYLVMELLEGEGFDQRLARIGCFSAAEAAACIGFIARGLEVAHRRGFVHRDIKPGNLFLALDARGEVTPKLLDFGVAKATGTARGGDMVKTSTGAVLGSPLYMSPEQARGEEEMDGRSDLWSLGVILYELLSGKPPFDAANYNALMVSILSKPHVSLREAAPGVPAELAAVVDLALTKDRTRRISTAREFADQLEAIGAALSGNPLSHMGAPGINPSLQGSPATTHGAWTTARANGSAVSPARRIVALTAAAATVLAVGTVGVLRFRPERVGIARRGSILLASSLVRLTAKLEAQRTEEDASVAAPTLKEVAAPVAPATPASNRPAVLRPNAGPKPTATRRSRRDDPHGGVEGSGF